LELDRTGSVNFESVDPLFGRIGGGLISRPANQFGVVFASRSPLLPVQQQEVDDFLRVVAVDSMKETK